MSVPTENIFDPPPIVILNGIGMKFAQKGSGFSEFVVSLNSENAGKNSAFDSIGKMRMKTRIRFLTNFMVL